MSPPFARAAPGRPLAATPLGPQSRATPDAPCRAWRKETARHRGDLQGPSRPHARAVHASAEAWGLPGRKEGRAPPSQGGCDWVWAGDIFCRVDPQVFPRTGGEDRRPGRVCSQRRRLSARTSLSEWLQEAEKAQRREPGGDQIPRPPASLLASRVPRSPRQGGSAAPLETGGGPEAEALEAFC